MKRFDGMLFSDFCTRSVFWISSVLFFFITINNYLFWRTSEYAVIPFIQKYYVPVVAFVFLSAAAGTLAVIRFGRYFVAREQVGIYRILALALFLRLLWILFCKTEPVSDFSALTNAAVQWLSGDTTFVEDAYFIRFPFQIGYVAYEFILLKLFGGHLVSILLFNVFFQTASVYLFYRILKFSAHLSAQMSAYAALLYAVYLPNIAICSINSNEIPALFFYLLGVDFLLERSDSPLFWAAAGLFVSIGNTLRPIGIIILIAAVLWAVLILAPVRGAKLLVAPVVFVAVYLIWHRLFTLITPPTALEDLWFKFILGLNFESVGAYNLGDFQWAGDAAQEQRIIIQRLSDSRLPTLLIKKFQIMWSHFDSIIGFSVAEHSGDERNFVWLMLSALQRLEYCILFNLICLGIVKRLKVRNAGIPAHYLLSSVIAIGYIMVYELIEIQTRYRFAVMAFLFLICADSLSGYISMSQTGGQR